MSKFYYIFSIVFSLLIFESKIFSQDNEVQILEWDLSVSNTTYNYDVDTLENVSYIKGTGLVDVSSGKWKSVPTGYRGDNDYIEISFSPKTGNSLIIEVTNLSFTASTVLVPSLFKVNNFQLTYSKNSDFSDSTIVIDFPNGDISSGSSSVNHTFDLPISLNSEETLYIRWYPFNSANNAASQFILSSANVLFNGIVRDSSSVSPISNLSYTRGCASEGQLTWTLPSGFVNTTDSIAIFAKKTSLIDQGTPSYLPNEDYGTPDTDLSTLDGVITSDIVYENDASAMLVYLGTGTSLDLTGFEDGTDYYFVAYNVEGDGAGTVVYSNGSIINGASPDDLEGVSNVSSISKPLSADISWTIPTGCADSVMVICNTSPIDSLEIDETSTSYASRDNSSYTDAGNGFKTPTDFSEGRVMYVGTGSSVSITDLTNATSYNVTIWTTYEGTWSANANLTIFPNEYKAILTQTKGEDTDFVEFLTLTEIDFSSLDYNLRSNPVCESGKIIQSYGQGTGPDFFDGLDFVSAGTVIRVYSGSGTDDLDSDNGLVILYAGTNLALNAFGGEQVVLYNGINPVLITCTSAPQSFEYITALNYGNAGWLAPGSNIDIDANNSYAPPSVSNLEMPATSTPNFSLKDQTAILGNAATIHDEVSDINTNWSTGTGSSPAVKLKDILFNEDGISGGGFASAFNDSIKITMNEHITVTDSVDIRYMVVACAGGTPGTPADRYTCYFTDLDYTSADEVVTSVSGQFATTGDPCGTTITGLGYVVYFAKDTSTFYIKNLPCGGEVHVSIYAVTGNGITANVSSGLTEAVLMPTANNTYYSTTTGGYSDGGMWNSLPGGGGSDFSDDFSDCVSLVVQNGNEVTFDDDILFGDLTIDAGGEAILSNITMTLTKDLVANDDFVTTDSRLVMAGVRQKNTISGSGYIELFELEVNNSYSTIGNDKLEVQDNISISDGIFITDGDLTVTTGDTITLLAEVLPAASVSRSAFLGEIPSTSTVSGAFSVERFLPTITTSAPGGSGQGVGWRYLSSTVIGADYEQVMDDFTCTGFTNSQYPNFMDAGGHYFPNLQKYDETVQGAQSFGFDGDHFSTAANTPTTAPDIRIRRDKAETIGQGEGIFAYIGPVEQTFDFKGTPNTGAIDVDMTYTTNEGSTDDGWNLVANPYPCAVVINDVLTQGQPVDGTIYIYNAETGIFQSINRTSPFTFIAAGQAFWAKVGSAGTATFKFTEASKRENANVQYIKSDEQFDRSLIVNLEMESNSLYKDHTTIWFNDDATSGFDNDYDAYKLYSLLGNVSGIATTIEAFESDASINAIPSLTEETEIPIKVNIRQAGNYSLDFTQTGDYVLGACLTLHDLLLDSVISVDMTTVYSFYSELRAESADARFTLTMSPPIALDAMDATCFESTTGSATAMGVGASTFTYSWYDANGILISDETSSTAATINDLATGFYSVVIEGNDTECAVSTKEFFIAQPAALETSAETLDPTCNSNDGWVTIYVDTAATWSLTWFNEENGGQGSIDNVTDYYSIPGLGDGTWEVTATSECGSQVHTMLLDDNNPVIADFEMESTTVTLVDGEVQVDFTNTSINANDYSWFYADGQTEEDNSANGSYVYTEAGIYGVSLFSMNENGCYDEVTYELIVLDPVGINDVENGLIRSYIAYGENGPQYVLELKDVKDVQVQMVNAMGQVISTQQVNVNGKTFVDLPTYDLSSGIYIIITLDDGTRIDSKKLFVR